MIRVRITFKMTQTKAYTNKSYVFKDKAALSKFLENAAKDHSYRKVIGVHDK